MPELSAMLLGVNPPQSPRLKIAPSVPVKAWGEPRQDEKSSSAMRKILLTSSDTQILTLSEQANEIYLYSVLTISYICGEHCTCVLYSLPIIFRTSDSQTSLVLSDL